MEVSETYALMSNESAMTSIRTTTSSSHRIESTCEHSCCPGVGRVIGLVIECARVDARKVRNDR